MSKLEIHHEVALTNKMTCDYVEERHIVLRHEIDAVQYLLETLQKEIGDVHEDASHDDSGPRARTISERVLQATTVALSQASARILAGIVQ